MEEGSNTSTNLSHAEVPAALTPGEIWFQLVVAYFIIGVMSIVLHALIAVCVYQIERLRNRFYVFIFFMSIARILYATCHVMLAGYRIPRTLGYASMQQTTLNCHLIHTFAYISATMDMLLLLLLVVDRTVSLWSPHMYRNLSVRQSIWICSGATAFCFFFRFLPSYAGVSTAVIVRCVNLNSPVTHAYSLYGKYLDFFMSIAILFAYGFLMLAAHKRTGGGTKSTVSDAAIKKAMKVMPFLRLQLIVHCTLILTSRSMQLAAGYVGEETLLSQRLVAYYGETCSVDVLINAAIFYWKHPKLWYESVKMICGERVALMVSKKPDENPTLIVPSAIVSVRQVVPMPVCD